MSPNLPLKTGKAKKENQSFFTEQFCVSLSYGNILIVTTYLNSAKVARVPSLLIYLL